MKESKVDFSYSFRQLCHMYCWYTRQMNICELASSTVKSMTKEMEQLLLNVISVQVCIRPMFCILQKLLVYLRLIFLFPALTLYSFDARSVLYRRRWGRRKFVQSKTWGIEACTRFCTLKIWFFQQVGEHQEEIGSARLLLENKACS